jgi:hypothetical protein
VEPVTGNLIDLNRTENLYYYDQQTFEDVSLWKKVVSKFSYSSVVDLAAQTRSQISFVNIVSAWVVVIVMLTLAIIIAYIVGSYFDSHKKMVLMVFRQGCIRQYLPLVFLCLLAVWQLILMASQRLVGFLRFIL